MFCGKCGRKLEDGTTNCPFCKTTINKKHTNSKFDMIKRIIISVVCLALIISCICFTSDTIYSTEYLHNWTIEYETTKTCKKIYENFLSTHNNDISNDSKISISETIKDYEYNLEYFSEIVREGEERLKRDSFLAVCSGILSLGSGVVLIISIIKSKKDKRQQVNI